MMAAALLIAWCVCLATQSALDFIPAGLLSNKQRAKFAWGVEHIKVNAPCIVAYTRHGGSHRSADKPMGGRLVRPVEERRVRVSSGFRAHLDEAIQLPFPLDSRLRATALSDDLQCAVSTSTRAGPDLPRLRAGWMAIIKFVSDALRPISNVINTLMPSWVARISFMVNTAYTAAIVDALNWLDKSIVQRFVYGFQIVGDIPDSGVYRPIQPVGTMEAHNMRYDYFVRSSRWANHRLHDRLELHSNSNRFSFIDYGVASKSRKELSKGVIVGPFNSARDALKSIMHSAPAGVRSSVKHPRAMNRFGVIQKVNHSKAVDDPTRNDTRNIDDAKSNGANAATRTYETVTTVAFFFPAVVARAILVSSEAESPAQRMPAITTSLCDLSMAYRTVPTSQPWFTVVGFANPTTTPPRPQYFWLPGHNFGLVSAVLNFNRYAELVTISVRAQCAVPNDHYYDDFIVTDLAIAGRTGVACIEQTVLALGTGARRQGRQPVRSPELDPLKTAEPAPSNKVLGVWANVSMAHQPARTVTFHVDRTRVEHILDEFRRAFDRGSMSAHEASSLRGKLGFCLTAAYANVGRAATLPLVQRQHRDTFNSFQAGSELHHSMLFFEALLPNLPPLQIPLKQDSTPPLLVYTDASFHLKRKKRKGECALSPLSRLSGGLGAVVIDPIDRTARFASAKPSWAILLSSWKHDRKTYIAELETLAAIAVYTTYPKLFAGRKVNHFIDNTVAQSVLVHGYAKKPDLAKPVNVFYLQMLSLRASVYFDWVPSKANIADLPSRFDPAGTLSELSGFNIVGDAPDVLLAPNIASWNAPLSDWTRSKTESNMPL